ncbi:thermostable hemolysin [Hydrogenophaga sp.]|uniref:thermostable hemolysin n=1 Tax=Hydrogenophaga sp. TaxID=1904254 RepID=UPI00272178A1|nr:thermostable hemolysin [Hydrogenophaga sp.]MDO8906199.1 thermostable hemolysin [Hydrogenophaga sp.]
MQTAPWLNSVLSATSQRLLPPPRRLNVHPADDPRRPEVEAFIQRVFSARFDAQVQQFAPVLVSLSDPLSGRILTAAGYRAAGEAPLFLETYLGDPVERLLSGICGRSIDRAGIVEVGHLAAEQAGEGRRLILLLGQHLADEGVQWVVSTLTEPLRQLFARIGITPLALGRANPDRLGTAAAAAWGSYYEHEPIVLAGQLPQALKRLARRESRQRLSAGVA